MRLNQGRFRFFFGEHHPDATRRDATHARVRCQSVGRLVGGAVRTAIVSFVRGRSSVARLTANGMGLATASHMRRGCSCSSLLTNTNNKNKNQHKKSDCARGQVAEGLRLPEVFRAVLTALAEGNPAPVGE